MTKTQAVGPQAPVQLRCEYVRNPLGIDRPKPRLSWVLEHSAPNQYQRAYQIIVADDKALISQGRRETSGTAERLSVPLNRHCLCRERAGVLPPVLLAGPLVG